MALASRDTNGEPSRLPSLEWVGIKVGFDAMAPQMPSSALLSLSLPSPVSVDIPGTIPEWVCWHLPNVYLTHCEYDGHIRAAIQAPGSGRG